MRRVSAPAARALEPLGDDKALLLDEGAAEDVSVSSTPSTSLQSRLARCFTRSTASAAPRTVELPSGRSFPLSSYPRNVVRNAKYSLTSFFPLVLYQQFRFFFNLYFLVIALSQFIPALQIGFLFTYVSPLVFVLAVTLCKEAWDDIKRHMRDAEANSEQFERLTEAGPTFIPARDIVVGHLIIVRANQRVPADLILLRTSEQSGASFLRTDQLDGETDWKLRRPLTYTQRLASDRDLFSKHISIYAEAPKKDIYSFVGKATISNGGNEDTVEGISVEQTAWAGTVVATGTVVGVVLYTGSETRAALNTSAPRSKTGVLEWELNTLSKVLFAVMLALSLLMVIMRGLHGAWPLQFFRYLILFSSIIPISLRVNLDMAKTVYTWQMMRDPHMPGIVARSSTIPEELGRVVYLLSDKTGTLTRNEMHFRRLHTGATSYASSDEGMGELRGVIRDEIARPSGARPGRRTAASRALAALQAVAVTHSVTPGEAGAYHGTSPDEVALVHFAHDVGLSLVRRSQNEMVVRDPNGTETTWEVLASFPFSSATKRMGIVLQQRSADGAPGPVMLFMKGADEVIGRMVEANDWLDEECSNLAREGLRTLVYARRVLSPGVWQAFQARYAKAKESMEDREGAVRAAIAVLEEGLELLAVTGVEDQLQAEVRSTLECLRHAGVKVWMLTGDKLETATCIAHSSGLVPSGLPLFSLRASTRAEASNQLNALSAQTDTALAVDGATLQILLKHLRAEFIDAACKCPAVLACRCSPTQKAELVELVRAHTGAQVCAVGDGGNDVSMIQAADVGLGLVGREGAQASLAADFSLTEFRHIRRLLLWHGRNSYKRSARLAQFVFHRGLIISWVQAVFSAIYYFAAISIYTGWLMVGYTTVFTMAPVFSLVLDEDVRQELVFRYPELYHELQKGRALSYRTFFIWMLKSIYQGGSIMLLAILLFESSFQNIVAITFSALVMCELLNVAFEVHHWHPMMVVAEICTVLLYCGSLFVLRTYFDASFILTWAFAWRVLLLTAVSSLPVYISKVLQHRFEPSAGSKLTKEEEP